MVGKGDANNQITVGISVATDQKLKVGDTYKIRGQDFEVVGILNKTMTGPDSYVFMAIKPAREMLIESNPFMKSLAEQGRLKLEDVNSSAGVSWKDGADSEKVSQAIKDKVGDKVIVMSPQKMGEQIDKASVTFNAIIFGSAVLALIVGLFSIVNTMIMSISERTKEIGIKKAIGASPGSIIREYTFEAGVIGLLGGLVGLGFGYIMIAIVNAKLASKGAEIFLVDINFFVEVVIFAFVIGMIAGVMPAIRASKMKVVDAIREL
jgi:putative ABC transport system permease protein